MTRKKTQDVQENMKGLKEQDVQELTTGLEDIAGRIYAVSFMMDYMKNPEDTLFDYSQNSKVSSETYSEWVHSRFIKLVEKVSKEHNIDPEQLADQNKRTEEQHKLLLEAAAKEQMARLDSFLNTNFMQATSALMNVSGKYPEPDTHDDYSLKEFAVLYFFALHYKDIAPTDPHSLTEEHIKEIKDIFSRVDSFFYDQTDGGKSEHSPLIFINFIKTDSPEPAETLEQLPRIMTTPPDSLEYPIDKINSNIWEDLAAAVKESPDGQLAFATEKNGSNNEATIIYSISFEELEKLDGLKLTKSLTPFDKRVYIAVNAIYAQSGDYMSAGQVFAAMGNTGKPSKKQLEKVNESLTKMGAARVYLDNTMEIGVNTGYTRFKYDAPLLPFERVSAYINNALVESAIHLFREPPLMTFAKERKQVTTITKKLLESPVSKTESNLRLDDYLIERIARMKSGKGKSTRKMLYSTIYEKCQITTRNQRSRAPDTIKRYLDYYIKCGWITGYMEEADGVTITF